MDLQVQAQGVTQTVAVLEGVADGLQTLAPPEATAILVAESRRRAPRRTGALASSIGGTTTGREVRVGTSIRYGWPVHSGVPARGITPRPFLEQALATQQAAVVEAYTNDLGRLLDEQAAKGYHA